MCTAKAAVFCSLASSTSPCLSQIICSMADATSDLTPLIAVFMFIGFSANMWSARR